MVRGVSTEYFIEEVIRKSQVTLELIPISQVILVIQNGHLVVVKQQSKPNKTHTKTPTYMYTCLYTPRNSLANLRSWSNIRLAPSLQGHLGWANYDEQFCLKKKRRSRQARSYPYTNKHVYAHRMRKTKIKKKNCLISISWNRLIHTKLELWKKNK